MSEGRPQVDVVGLHRCTTCQRIVRTLGGRGIEVRRFRDLREDPVSRVELVSISNRVGGPSRLFSRRALKYRALGLDRRTLNEEEMLTYMLEEATFVTRPVVLAVEGPAAVCGSSAKALDGLVRTLLGSR